jgi:copper chaperone CopZ
VRVSVKAISGVESVDVSLEKGLAAVKMKPGNTATLKQFQAAITKNGFAMKDSRITIAGKLLRGSGGSQLQVSGSNEILALQGNVPESLIGKTVVVTGTIPEAPKRKAPDTVRVESIAETQ